MTTPIVTEKQREYITVKRKKFAQTGLNALNACPINGELFWVVLGSSHEEGEWILHPTVISLLHASGVKKFFAISENDGFEEWLETAECKTFEDVIPAFHPCFLCDGVATAQQGFMPSGREGRATFNVPAKTVTTFFYHLCDLCAKLPERDARVEAKIFARIPSSSNVVQ
jgi:hypothetical protein